MIVHVIKMDGHLGSITWDVELGIAKFSFLSLDKSMAWTGEISTELVTHPRFKKAIAGCEEASDGAVSQAIDRGFQKQIFEFLLNQDLKIVCWKRVYGSGKIKRRLAEIAIEQRNYDSVILSFITTPYCRQPEHMTRLRDIEVQEMPNDGEMQD